MKITITPKNSPTELDFYVRITSALKKEEGFGNNLDALYDILTEPRPKFEIYVKDADFESKYGGRGEKLIAVMRDAAKNGGCFTLRIRNVQRRNRNWK